ncbi:chemotaxis response regulator protein-glutamate methylesterase [Spirochaetia bacterium]|nr:chemotaxis response regulator protein-glutamate methylesterase [Spirochaetia bacterium]GHV92755.1 chemotaxis response regulator protein-glutamate methylesterase [Spirochaetia bacterium]
MINTLIADDSPLARSILRDFLESDPAFRIIGEADDGEDAVQKTLALNPDLVTMDIEMPKMTGLEAIDAIMKKMMVPIVVISSQDTAKTAYEATVKGALEFYSKDLFSSAMSPAKQARIFETLKRISGVKGQRSGALEALTETKVIEDRKIAAVVIASSTGGPKALSRLFSLMPGDFPVPLMVVQHNSSGFDRSFVQWLNDYTELEVKLAEEGEIPIKGKIYVAQTDKHLALRSGGPAGTDAPGFSLAYTDDEPENNQKPAADVLFRTAAQTLGKSVVSVVLTGMGSDGAEGTRNIKELGGITLAQDEDSSLIYGMPRAARETGCVDRVLPLDRIPEELSALTKGSR